MRPSDPNRLEREHAAKSERGDKQHDEQRTAGREPGERVGGHAAG